MRRVFFSYVALSDLVLSWCTLWVFSYYTSSLLCLNQFCTRVPSIQLDSTRYLGRNLGLHLPHWGSLLCCCLRRITVALMSLVQQHLHAFPRSCLSLLLGSPGPSFLPGLQPVSGFCFKPLTCHSHFSPLVLRCITSSFCLLTSERATWIWVRPWMTGKISTVQRGKTQTRKERRRHGENIPVVRGRVGCPENLNIVCSCVGVSLRMFTSQYMPAGTWLVRWDAIRETTNTGRQCHKSGHRELKADMVEQVRLENL